MKHLNIKLLIPIACLLTSGWIHAQVVSLKATIDSSSNIKIGEQVKLRLEVDQPKTVKVSFPIFTDTISSKVEWVETLKADTTINGQNLHIRQDYVITSFDSGSHQIAPLVITFRSGTKTDTLRTEPLFLKVSTVQVDTTKEIKDIHAPFRAPLTFADIWIYLAAGLGLILIIFGIWFYLKKRKNEPFFGVSKPKEPAHVVALRDLDSLRSEKLWQQGKEKQYFTKLTDVLRQYLEARYVVPALEMTSDEIVTALKSANMDNISDIDLLISIFTTSDLVKFAKAHPLPDENEVAMLNAYQFINNTKLFVAVEKKEPDQEVTDENINQTQK